MDTEMIGTTKSYFLREQLKQMCGNRSWEASEHAISLNLRVPYLRNFPNIEGYLRKAIRRVI